MQRIRQLLGLVLLIIFLKFLVTHVLLPSIEDLTEEEKCPACYGTLLCSAFSEGHIKLQAFNIINIIGVKNVLFGYYNGKDVVMKKLGHTTELNRLDDMICEVANLTSGCHVNKAILQGNDLLHSISRYVSQIPPIREDSADHISGLHLCPSVVNLKLLLSSVLPSNYTIDLLANIWTIVMINPEPLIIQILKEEDGWPVPKYLGACGRVVVEEYVGVMLSSYYDAPWLQRLNLTFQLMVAAHNFTHSHPDFSFYLTDISAENIAVDTDGKVKFIDMENVIVVDKNIPKEDMPPTWNTPHDSENFECDGCFAFSLDDICRHKSSDHNFYAVCQNILSPMADEMLPQGLLHDIPPRYNHLLELVQLCSKSTEPSGKLKAAYQLITALKDILIQ